MSEWKKCHLGELITDIAAGPFGSNLKISCFVPSGFPIIDGANLKGFKVTDNITKFVTEEKARSLPRSIAKRNDVIVTISGTLGQIAYIPEESEYEEYLCSQRQFRATFDQSQVDVPFLVYYFHSREGQQKILVYANQVGVPALYQPLKNFRLIEIPLPPLPTQRKIAAVLGALDDKIENNRKICANLEAQAQAIFKSWFVDFEPFGGKMPQGWKMGKLGELIEVCYGKDHKALPEGDIPVFGSGGYMRSVDRCIFDEESVLIPRKGTLNNIMYVNEPFWTVDTMFYSKMREEHVAKYVHLLLQGKNMDEFNVGSAVPSMTTEILNNMEIIIPLTKTLQEFDGIASSFYAEVAHAKKQSRSLAAMRDALLPELMSGEIDVEKVEVA